MGLRYQADEALLQVALTSGGGEGEEVILGGEE